MKVLVTDSQIRSALALTRSLGRRGNLVITSDSEKISTSFFSKYTAKKFVYPDVVKDELGFVKSIKRLAEKEKIDVIFPIGGETTLALAKYRDLFNGRIKIPVTDYSRLLKAANKAETFKIAEKIGIPIPKTYQIKSFEDLNRINFFPVILKPLSGSGSRGIALCKNRDELENNYKTSSMNYSGFIVQDYIPVTDISNSEFCWYGIFDWDSELVGYGCYKNIRTYPSGSGPSTLQESVENEKINLLAIKLLKHLKWQGLAQIDFRVDARDNEPKLLEINHRMWAPLQHSISSGLDVPGIWLNLALGKSVPKQPPIKVGIRTRWLLPGDILWFLSNPKNYKNIKDFFSFKDCDYEIIKKYDLKPVIGFLLASFTYIFDRKKRQMIIR